MLVYISRRVQEECEGKQKVEIYQNKPVPNVFFFKIFYDFFLKYLKSLIHMHGNKMRVLDEIFNFFTMFI